MSDFGGDIEKFTKKALKNFSLVQRGVALQLSAGVIDDTPVDTGRARANWVSGRNEHFQGVVDTKDPSGNETVTNVAGAINNLTAEDTFTLTNNLDYIGALEDGHSQKAPEGMLERNVARFDGIVQASINEVDK